MADRLPSPREAAVDADDRPRHSLPERHRQSGHCDARRCLDLAQPAHVYAHPVAAHRRGEPGAGLGRLFQTLDGMEESGRSVCGRSVNVPLGSRFNRNGRDAAS